MVKIKEDKRICLLMVTWGEEEIKRRGGKTAKVGYTYEKSVNLIIWSWLTGRAIKSTIQLLKIMRVTSSLILIFIIISLSLIFQLLLVECFHHLFIWYKNKKIFIMLCYKNLKIQCYSEITSSSQWLWWEWWYY